MMGWYLEIDEQFAGDVGSSTELARTGRYLRSLDARKYPNLNHLAEYGFTTFILEARNELAALLSQPNSPDIAVEMTLARILENLKEFKFKDDSLLEIVQ